MKGSRFREETATPSLFWRIDEAEQTRQGRGTSISVYRADVLRNLRWLLNASAHREGSTIWDLPQASDSVLNFGIPPYSGRFGTNFDADELAWAMRAAILRFEPRIIADSLQVVSVDDDDGEGNRIGFRISGSIWSQPVPERFSMETSIDTASGAWTFDSRRDSDSPSLDRE